MGVGGERGTASADFCTRTRGLRQIEIVTGVSPQFARRSLGGANDTATRRDAQGGGGADGADRKSAVGGTRGSLEQKKKSEKKKNGGGGDNEGTHGGGDEV